MWIRCKISKDKYFYYLDEYEYIIEIRKGKAFRYIPVNSNGKHKEGDPFYSGVVLSKSGSDIFLLEDPDLDVLKLKCLLKAKEFGWDIKEVL